MNSYGDRLHFSKRIAVLNSYETSLKAVTCAQSVQVIVLHGWASISPPELIPPPSPGQDFAGTEDSGEDFSGTGHGPFRPLIVSNLK